MKTRIALFKFFLMALIFSGCVNQLKEDVKITAAYYPNHSPSENQRVFVFVHGIFGDAYETWRNENGTYFFDLIKGDRTEEFKESDIFVFGYPSGFKGKTSFTIDEAADTLALYMRQFKVSADHKEIIFVAHSMGGLITIKYLLRNPDVAKKVPLVFLYSTPLNGSNIAKIGAFFSDNPGLPAMYPNESENDRNFYLTSLIDDWKDKIYNKGGPTIRCAYEKEPIAGNLIVDRVSASLICIGRSVAIPANHKNMFRKADYNSVSYLALKDAISENERIIKMRKTDQADGSELKAKYPYGYCLFTVDDRNIITPYSSTFSRDYDIGWDLAMILNSTENEINLQLPSINSL